MDAGEDGLHRAVVERRGQVVARRRAAQTPLAIVGVVADPDVTNVLLTKDDAWIVVASDGLFENEVRGGGGGLSNDEVAELLNKNKNKSCKELGAMLCEAAEQAGSTDDITVVVAKL